MKNYEIRVYLILFLLKKLKQISTLCNLMQRAPKFVVNIILLLLFIVLLLNITIIIVIIIIIIIIIINDYYCYDTVGTSQMPSKPAAPGLDIPAAVASPM